MQCDYLIVGGGTAGCILAERLSASGRHRVLLLEAGGKPRNPFVKIPAGFAKLFKSGCDWDYTTTPQTHVGNRHVYVPRGKMLGGSANMNAMIHQWGHLADFDGWGVAGWGWQDVLPMFRKLESELAFETNGHAHPAAAAFVDAARKELGHAEMRYNGNVFEGAWISEIATRGGKRHSVYESHLKPAMRRRNLRVITDAKVDEVMFEQGRAVGASLMIGGETRMVRANAGVILSAGAIESPALLMRSGIGNGGDLNALGIETLVHSPHVGQHLQDHPMAVPTFATAHNNTYKSAESLPNLLNYLFRKKGPLASNAAEAIAFARSSTELKAVDVELLFAPLEWRKQALESPLIHAFSIGVAVVAPQSRGEIRLASADPRHAPIIDYGLFSDAKGADRKAMLSGLRLARKVAATSPLAGHIAGEHAPGIIAQSDEALWRWVNEEIQTVYHPACSASMGDAINAVVSPQLAVHGTERLWVADASVMPTLVRGHPNTAVAMIAARAAGFIAAA